MDLPSRMRPHAVLAVEQLVGPQHALLDGARHDEALDRRSRLELILHRAVAPDHRIAARLVGVEDGIAGQRQHRSAANVEHHRPATDRARRLDRFAQLFFRRQLDGAVEGQRDRRAGEIGRIRHAVLEHHVAPRVARRLDLDRPAAQHRLELALEALLSRVLADESEDMTGHLALRVEALRLLHQLDAVERQRPHARRGGLVDPSFQPDKLLVRLRDLLQQLALLDVQRARQQPGRFLASFRSLERRRIGEHGVDVARDRERVAMAVDDQPAPRRPLQLTPGLVALQPREPRSIEQLHLRGAAEDRGEEQHQERAEQQRAHPHPARIRSRWIRTHHEAPIAPRRSSDLALLHRPARRRDRSTARSSRAVSAPAPRSAAGCAARLPRAAATRARA